jgi:4-amino-4-deoxy-L-arabinose transferase-like glycosyltransferase
MRLTLPALAALCALVLFTGLDRVGYTDAREARDAHVARELIVRREPITPLVAGEPLFEKPVFAYVPEIVARLWPAAHGRPDSPRRSRQIRAVFALMLVIVTGALAASRFGPRAGAWSALVLASAMGLPFAARTDGTQLVATLLGWCACAAFADSVAGQTRAATSRLLLAYGAMATAMLVGGPLPALWPLGGIALFAALARDRSVLSRVRPLPGLTIVIAAALPWYGAMVDRNGPHVLAAALQYPYGAEAPGNPLMAPLLTLSFLVVAFYPWSALLPEALRHAAAFWRGGAPARDGAAAVAPAPPTIALERREERAAHWMVANLAVACLPAALHAGVPLTAVLPALPAAAILCGRFADHALEDAARLARPITGAARMMALVGTLGALLLALTSRRLPEAAADVRLLAAVTFVTAWLPLLAAWRDRHRAAIVLMALPVALGTPVTTMFVMPAMEGYLNARAVAATLNDHAPPLAPVVVFEPPPPSLRLYARRNIVNATPRAAALHDLRASDGFTYIAFPPRSEGDVARKLAIPLEVVMRGPSLVLARVDPDTPALSDTTRR